MTVAALLFDSATKLKLVVDTEGNDIERLMEGLRQLSKVALWGGRGLWISAVSAGVAIIYLLLMANGG